MSRAARTRLLALGLDAAGMEALEAATRRPRTVLARRELIVERLEIAEAMVLLDGWAARVRQLADGRRQVLAILLPGDVIGMCDHEHPVATSSAVAITDVQVCTAPGRAQSRALSRVYALSRALEESFLMAQITRLGRLHAYERVADLLLELLERLELAGSAHDGRFTIPITQELLADTLGLTSVHINRTLRRCAVMAS
jgi:CRP-like cAMP-binding protein